MTKGYVQAWTLDRSPIRMAAALVDASRVTEGPGESSANFEEIV